MLSADEWIKMGCIYIYIYIYNSVAVKKKILTFAKSWMKLECVVLSETNQTGKEKYDMI